MLTITYKMHLHNVNSENKCIIIHSMYPMTYVVCEILYVRLARLIWVNLRILLSLGQWVKSLSHKLRLELYIYVLINKKPHISHS